MEVVGVVAHVPFADDVEIYPFCSDLSPVERTSWICRRRRVFSDLHLHEDNLAYLPPSLGHADAGERG